ncbi:MAG: hypothetical protein HY875_05995 [Chloroflexi bacterium]|nr:hypothetical protein [Chloroflexota bacterium]
MDTKHFRRWALILPAMLAVVAAFALVACGGDDDDDDTGGSGGDTGGNVQTGSDEKYVGQICKAMKTFTTSLDAATKDLSSASNGDVDKLLEKMAAPFDQLAKDFGKANPPKDMKDWHVAATKALQDIAKSLKDAKGLDALDALGEDPFPEPPAGVEERLSKLADNNADCKAAQFDFGE